MIVQMLKVIYTSWIVIPAWLVRNGLGRGTNEQRKNNPQSQGHGYEGDLKNLSPVFLATVWQISEHK